VWNKKRGYQDQGRRRFTMAEQTSLAACGGPVLEQQKGVRRKEQQRGTTVY